MRLKKTSTLSDTQHQALDYAMRLLRSAFPGLADAEIVSRHLLPHLLGPLPDYSNLKGYALNKTTLAAVAANVVCYGIDPETNEPVIILVSRKEKNQRGRHFLGHIGGYVNLDCVRGKDGQIADPARGEQPQDGVIGEVDEETRDARNKALLNLSTDRLELLTGGINYQVEPPVAYFAYTAELTEPEIWTLRGHAAGLSCDGAYLARTLKNNDHEVFGIHVIPLTEAKKITADAFLYEATWTTFQAALKKIEGSVRPEKIMGSNPYTTLTK
jgi:hypothetical protein